MSEAISLCGFNCGICPAYKSNLISDEDRATIDEGWKKFHRSRGWIYQQPYCEGCFNTSEKAPLWSSCPIRKCALTNNVETCGNCLDFPCPRIRNMISITTAIAERTRKEGTEEDFQKFALPHLNEARLEEIHQKVRKPKDTEVQPVYTTTAFPSNLNTTLSKPHLEPDQFITALKLLHSILESIMALHCWTPGGREQELKRHKENAKFLWAMGRHATLLTNQDGPLLEITTKEIKKHLKYGKHKTKRNLQELAKHGIEGDYIGDTVRLRFTEKLETAIILQQYIRLLLENNSKRKAYSKFWKADMDVFSGTPTRQS